VCVPVFGGPGELKRDANLLGFGAAAEQPAENVATD
jgi:hypothetical protein